jgi:hypothetical protein
VNFHVKFPYTTERPPTGFLFLCPEDFKVFTSSVRWPDCPAYWSLHPTGADILGTEEAAQLGFPSIKLTSLIHGYY